MARKSNCSLVILGLGVGTAATVYFLKKYTTIFDPVIDAWKDKDVRKKVNVFLYETKSSTQKLAKEINELVQKKAKQAKPVIMEFIDTLEDNIEKEVKKGTVLRKRSEEFLRRTFKTRKASQSSAKTVSVPLKKALKKSTVKPKAAKKPASTVKASVKSTKKNGKEGIILTSMKKGQMYTQRELSEVSKIPYRTVRRYIETLSKEGKITEQGYGKGKRFSKK